jgi:hypothetical protein
MKHFVHIFSKEFTRTVGSLALIVLVGLVVNACNQATGFEQAGGLAQAPLSTAIVPLPGADPSTWTAIADTEITGDIFKVGFGEFVVEEETIDVFVSGGASGAAAYSYDGANWTAITSSPTGGNDINGVVFGELYGADTLLIVAANGYAAYLADPSDLQSGWVLLDSSQTTITSNIAAAAYGEIHGEPMFVMGGDGGQAAYFDYANDVWVSIPDMVPIFGNARSNIRAMAYGDYNGGTFVAVGGQTGYPFPYAQSRSSDGIHWTVPTTPTSVFCRGLTYGNGVFLGVGYERATIENSAAFSTDGGVTWEPITSVQTGFPTTVTGVKWYNSVDFDGENFVAVGVGGAISYTADPTSSAVWTFDQYDSIFSGYINGITHGLDRDGHTIFVAVGDKGCGADSGY